MNEDNKIMVLFVLGTIVFLGLLAVGATIQRQRLDTYDNTITEYMMCVEYNPDCECSDIILSEYEKEQ